MDRMEDANRTCHLILGVGDGKVIPSDDGEIIPFHAVQYGYEVANIQTDKNMMPYNETWHQRLDQMIYHGMDWECPGFSVVL